ncbi:MAG: phosphopyruvate hydratase [archaeon]
MCDKILSLKGREILDSRGNPTVECELKTECGFFSASVPSGCSTGSFEAFELRDNSKAYGGKSVKKACSNITKIITPKIKGLSCTNQEKIDSLMRRLDGTKDKSNLGANSILAVSLACAKAAAASQNKQLFEYLFDYSNSLENKHAKKPNYFNMPIPFLNVINGGKHAGIDNDIQEHMIVPVNVKSFSEALRISSEVYHELKALLKKSFGPSAALIGDEGGFAPKELPNAEKRLEFISKAIDNLGYENNFAFALDCAASELFNKDLQKYKIGYRSYSANEMVDYYKDLISKFPIISIEDPFSEEDWEFFSLFTKEFEKKVQIVGDDLLVTNPLRIKKAISKKACNSLLLKVNQIGTLTEAMQAAELAKKAKWEIIVSHRSGETEETFIADLAVGLQSKFVKFGAPARTDRLCKYNQLLRIEEYLGTKARYPKI